ncbi:MAG TPA: T9SS type A sorting domain-containing protein, partial [Parafilimonas sp.]|nr:T9SS type A sorting domain-containing protein [Parafilimonas sp.]
SKSMFADDDEQKVESDYGMMLWQNGNYNYNQATMGYKNDGSNTDSWDLKSTIYQTHGFTQPGLVSYQESHDEERLMYKNNNYGVFSGGYTVKDSAIGLQRCGMATAFWATQPGPKMIWEFGELGYDFSINQCPNGGTSDACRTDPKYQFWWAYNNPDKKALYNVYKDLIHLKTYPDYTSTFINGTINYSLSDTIKWQSVVGSNLSVMLFGNFGVRAKTSTVTFPSTGTWYSYLTTKTITVSSTSYSVTLQPGEYYVYTNKNIKDVVLPVTWLSFTAQKNGAHSVLLNWSTQNEVNNDHFEIERSSNGTSFSKIGNANALTGNGELHYSFTDNIPLNGYNYYRIKQVDKEGNYQYSSIQRISLGDIVKRWNLYPNPAKNVAALHALNNYNKATISISDLRGRIIYSTVINNITVNQQISIPIQQLSKGVYVIKIVTEQGTDTQKLVVE